MACSLTVAATVAGWVAAGVLDSGRVLRSEPTPVAPGGRGELSITILEPPAPGVPLDIRVEAEGVRLSSERLGWSDVVDPQARQPRVSVDFTAPSQPGRYRVSGLVTWVTCEDRRCDTRRAAVAWTIPVQAPEPSPGS